MSKKSTNTPFGQGELEYGHGGIVPVVTFRRSTDPTQADYTVATGSATNVSVPDAGKMVRIKNISGGTLLVVAKDASNTGDCSTSNKDFQITEGETYDLAMPAIDRNASDFPTHVSLIASGSDVTAHVRFF